MTMTAELVNLGNRTSDVLTIEHLDDDGKCLSTSRLARGEVEHLDVHARSAHLRVSGTHDADDAWGGDLDLVVVPGDTPRPDGDLPLYRCHKLIRGFKIVGIDPLSDDGARLFGPNDKNNMPFVRDVDPQYVEKHQPFVGGYYVLYADGYESFSLAEAFEAGYTSVDEA